MDIDEWVEKFEKDSKTFEMQANFKICFLIVFVAYFACFALIAGCSATRTGGDYLSVPAPTKTHAPGPVEMPPKPAEAEYR
jgi:hypothetical protein